MAGAALLVVAGCAQTTIKDGGPAAWSVAPMEDSDMVPASADPSRRTRVVVLASEDSPTAQGAGLAAVASSSLEAILGSAGGVEVVERRLADRLNNELKLAEMKGSGSYGGPEVADYAVRVVMGNASWGSTFVPASSSKNLLTGKTVNTPAGHTYSGSSTMTVRIYAVPSLKLVEQFPVEGKVTVTEQPTPATQANAPRLMGAATESGVKAKKNEVLNHFAPRGYITERRVKEKVSIFRVQLGKNTGARTGNTVEIVTMQKVGSVYDEITLGKGVMSDVVGNDGSWIRVDDEKVAARVKKYDYVKVKRDWTDNIPFIK
jgi:hypothetical protein